MKKILGIDPGKDKTGAALCEESGKILRCEVLLMEHFLASLQKFLDHVPVTECVLGNGTTSASMQKTLLAAYPDLAIHIIEYNGVFAWSKSDKVLTVRTARRFPLNSPGT